MGLQALNPQAFMIIQVVTQLLEPRAAIHYNADFLLKLPHYFFALSPKEALILVSRCLFDEPLIYYRLFMCLTFTPHSVLWRILLQARCFTFTYIMLQFARLEYKTFIAKCS